MNSSRDRLTFWCCIAFEGVGSQIILWKGIPIYRRLLSDGAQGGGTADFVWAVVAVLLMQVGHWLAFRLKPRLQFRRNVLLGHALVFISELSLFFANALAVVILFDRMGELHLTVWKVIILVAILFAICCYKHQLTALGDLMIESEFKTVPKETQP
jgi:hypothetical protein